MKTIVYVMTHKPVEIPRISQYCSMLVGAKINKVKGEFDEKDDTGINISEKNPNYCELTGIYWIWKNSNVDIVGVCHYRRFFSRRIISGDKKYYLTAKDIESILDKYSIIIPKAKYSPRTTLLSINYAPNLKDLKEIYQAITECSPDYANDLIWYLNQNATYLFNMCIMKKKDFNQYCEWLFPILQFVEKNHNMDLEIDPYRKRLFGFLSERLLLVWIHHNIANDKIFESSVINTDESNFVRVKRMFGNITRRTKYILTKNLRGNIALQKDSLDYIMGISNNSEGY